MTDSTDNKPVKKIIKRATLPPKELIKGLPKNADIAANSSGGISVHYRYRSPEARKLSGGKAVLHLGTVQELIFRPTTNYLLHPEQYPIPEKQLKGRRVTMMRQKNVLPESAEQNAKSEIREQPLEDESKTVSLSVGAVLALLNAGLEEGILKALFVALARTFGSLQMNVPRLYRQVLTCALHKCVRGQPDRHLASFCENYATPTRMSSQPASDLYALLGKHIDALRQNFFAETARLVKENDQLAIDGTYLNSDGKNIPFAQMGMSKNHGYQNQISQLLVLSTAVGLPVMYMTNPGNMHDVGTLHGLRAYCRERGFPNLNILLTFDRGFMKLSELAQFKREKTDFLICAKMNLKLVQSVKEEVGMRIQSVSNWLRGHKLFGATRVRQLQASDKGSKVFVHVYYDPDRFKRDLDELMVKIESFQIRWNQQSVKDGESEDLRRFFKPLQLGEDAITDDDAIDAWCRDNCGYFALVSSNISNAETALKLYHLRNDAEVCFKLQKSLDWRTARTHNEITFLGKDFVMFVATMCACAVQRRLGRWKNGRCEEAQTEQPLNRNHDYPDLMNVLSSVRIDKHAGEKLPHFTNNGGKAARLLNVLGLDANMEPGAFMGLLLAPPKQALAETADLISG